jgi:predicted DNA-binding transcriptional regulator YafY
MWKGRQASLVRALSLLRTLEGGRRWTLFDLAEQFGVHHRTIRRDLEALESAGVPLTNDYEPGRGGRGEWWLCR